jgi:hypothetical protein
MASTMATMSTANDSSSTGRVTGIFRAQAPPFRAGLAEG